MRILLLDDAFKTTLPPGATFFASQLVLQAADAGHDLRDLMLHVTEPGKGLDAFRRALRRRLDAEVVAFDPQIIHVQGLGILGHLALETGVPYLISTWGDELLACQNDSPLRTYAQQAAENAGRILIADQEIEHAVSGLCGGCQERLVCLADHGWPMELPSPGDFVAPPLDWLWTLYRQLVAARRGLTAAEIP